MARRYLNIPLGAVPGLVEVQNLLRRKLPAGTVYRDPASFHVTLVYMEDDKGIDLSLDELTDNLPIFGIGANWVDTMETPENRVVVLELRNTAQLTYLQAAIYYAAASKGAKVSQFSYPNQWRPHITLATLPNRNPFTFNTEDRRAEGTFFSAPAFMEVRRFVMTEAGSMEPIKEWTLRADMPVQELQLGAEMESVIQLNEQTEDVNSRLRVTLTCISEMKGTYPKIPVPTDIDKKVLEQELGYKPNFVTLPLGQVDARSRNERTYRKSAVESLTRQIKADRPEGNWGHTPDDKIGTEYVHPAIRWLDAQMDEKGVVWGLGLPLTQETDRYYRVARATGAKVGTSIQAWAQMDGDDVTDMELIKIDLADPKRVGIPMTAAIPQLSQEMTPTDGGSETTEPPGSAPDAGTDAGGSGDAEQTPDETPETSTETEMEDNMPTTQEVVELEGRIQTLKTTNEQLEATIRQNKLVLEAVADIRKMFGIAENVDVVRFFRDYKDERDTLASENSKLLVSAMTARIDEQVKIPSVRPTIKALVAAAKPVTESQLEDAIRDVMAQEHIKELLKGQLAEQSGPNHNPTPNPPNQQPTEKWQDWLEGLPQPAGEG